MAARPTKTDVKQRYRALVDCIADLLGPRAEVVLHDVSHTDHSVVLIRNGHVTGRTTGAPLTDVGFYMLRESDRRIETLGVYQSYTEAGKRLKCNAVNLRDSDGKVEAILCINIDVTDENPPMGEQKDSPFTEHYQTSIRQVIDGLIADASGGHGSDLSTHAKLEVVRALDNRGVFLARGAVKQVAASLRIAAATVYKYIQDARRARALAAPREKTGARRPRRKSVGARARARSAAKASGK
jgi:predicted transcriptional regulator YheO